MVVCSVRFCHIFVHCCPAPVRGVGASNATVVFVPLPCAVCLRHRRDHLVRVALVGGAFISPGRLQAERGQLRTLRQCRIVTHARRLLPAHIIPSSRDRIVPLRSWTRWARMATAMSEEVRPPKAKPTGPWMRARLVASTPCRCSLSSRAAWERGLPRAPI